MSTAPQANTDKPDLQVFLNIGLCPEGLRQDRALGDASAICTDATPLGQIKLGEHVMY